MIQSYLRNICRWNANISSNWQNAGAPSLTLCGIAIYHSCDEFRIGCRSHSVTRRRVCAHLENRLGFLTGRPYLGLRLIATWIPVSFCACAVGYDASCVRVSSFHRGLESIYALWAWLCLVVPLWLGAHDRCEVLSGLLHWENNKGRGSSEGHVNLAWPVWVLVSYRSMPLTSIKVPPEMTVIEPMLMPWPR